MLIELWEPFPEYSLCWASTVILSMHLCLYSVFLYSCARTSGRSLKTWLLLGVLAYAFNVSIRVRGRWIPLSVRPVWSTLRILGQLGLHSENLFQIKDGISFHYSIFLTSFPIQILLFLLWVICWLKMIFYICISIRTSGKVAYCF